MQSTMTEFAMLNCNAEFTHKYKYDLGNKNGKIHSKSH